MAIKNNCVATIEVLINLGININAQNSVSELMHCYYIVSLYSEKSGYKVQCFTLSCMPIMVTRKELLCVTLCDCMSHIHIQHGYVCPCIIINSTYVQGYNSLCVSKCITTCPI